MSAYDINRARKQSMENYDYTDKITAGINKAIESASLIESYKVEYKDYMTAVL